MKRWAIVEVPEEIGMVKVQYFKRSDDLVFYENSREFKDNDILNSPVELMQAACKAAGVILARTAKQGDFIMNEEGIFFKSSMDRAFAEFRPVIPADPAPCPCQSLDPNARIQVRVADNGNYVCNSCGRVMAKGRPAPCPNCQNVKPGQVVFRTLDGVRCFDCKRPKSEWTYAQDDERYEIGVGV